MNMGLTIEKNRIGIESAQAQHRRDAGRFLRRDRRSRLAPRQISVRGTRIARPTWRASCASRNWSAALCKSGGTAVWAGGSNISATGNLHAYGVDYRDSTIRLRGGRARRSVEAERRTASKSTARGFPAPTSLRMDEMPIGGRIATVALHGRVLELRGVALAALGGTFHGDARLQEFDRYSVTRRHCRLRSQPIVRDVQPRAAALERQGVRARRGSRLPAP